MENGNVAEYKKLRDYIEIKYGNSYIRAIRKLSERNPYDENGLLKPEYILTDKEKEALLYYTLDDEKNILNRKQK